MSSTELTIAILLLLVTPGPTNSLVLLAGAERGFFGALRLIPAELSGYLLAVLPLTLIGASVLEGHHGLRAGVTVVAAIWVAVLAVRLWRVPVAVARAQSVGSRALFITTALNPKSLIFGLVLLPSPDRLAANVILFAILVVTVAVLWASLGAALRSGGAHQPRALIVLRRLASVWLGTISIVLMVRSIAV
mgnify:CR=1 FL=1